MRYAQQKILHEQLRKKYLNNNERKLLKKINEGQIKQTEHHEERLYSLF